MTSGSDLPIFFSKASQFRAWLRTNHSKRTHQWVGFHRKRTGKPSISWPESVDEALCFGWIDGLRKTVDSQSYKIRFSPRRPRSAWSAVNIKRMRELLREGRVHPAGIAAFQRRTARASGIYSYENRHLAVLSAAAQRQFRANQAAWKWFNAQSPSYRKTVVWWVVSAKRPETQAKRLARLISGSKAKRKVGLLQGPDPVRHKQSR